MPAITLLEKAFVLNLYGTLLLLVAPLVAGTVFVVLGGFGVPFVWSTIGAAAPGVTLIGWGLNITRRLSSKVRIAHTILKRIERKGFRYDYFKNTCRELCMRELTWLVLRKVGKQPEFRALLRMYSKEGGFYLEHSNPLIEELLNSGALRQEDLDRAVAQGLWCRRQRIFGSL